MWACPSLSDVNVRRLRSLLSPVHPRLSASFSTDRCSRTSTSLLLWMLAGYLVCVWHAGCFHSFRVRCLVYRSTAWRWNETSFHLAHRYRCRLQCMSLSLFLVSSVLKTLLEILPLVRLLGPCEASLCSSILSPSKASDICQCKPHMFEFVGGPSSRRG